MMIDMDKSNDCTNLKRKIGLFEVFYIAAVVTINLGLILLTSLSPKLNIA